MSMRMFRVANPDLSQKFSYLSVARGCMSLSLGYIYYAATILWRPQLGYLFCESMRENQLILTIISHIPTFFAIGSSKRMITCEIAKPLESLKTSQGLLRFTLERTRGISARKKIDHESNSTTPVDARENSRSHAKTQFNSRS
jgi:hypothetical protein